MAGHLVGLLMLRGLSLLEIVDRSVCKLRL